MKKITRISAAIVGAAGIAVAGVGIAQATLSPGAGGSVTVETESALPPDVPVAEIDMPVDAGRPTYVPTGARLNRHEAASHGFRSYSYRLAGAANQDTLDPAASAQDPTSLAYHPETEIQVSFAPTVTELSDFLVSDAWFKTRPISIGQFDGLVTTPRNGLGAHRVDWMSSNGSHTVMVDRILTADGVSGVGIRELLAMARSIPQ